MIQITEEQTAQVKYLLEQSMQGNHILFDSKTLRRVLGTPPSSDASTSCVAHHIEKVMGLRQLAQKHAYLERLDARTYDQVVRSYFNIVENRLLESRGSAH